VFKFLSNIDNNYTCYRANLQFTILVCDENYNKYVLVYYVGKKHDKESKLWLATKQCIMMIENPIINKEYTITQNIIETSKILPINKNLSIIAFGINIKPEVSVGIKYISWTQ
jgi:hypothetical protein